MNVIKIYRVKSETIIKNVGRLLDYETEETWNCY